MLDFLVHNELVHLPTNILTRSQYVNDIYLHTPYGANLDIVQNVSTLEEAISNLATKDEFTFNDSVFDCVTYVETILSMLLTSQLASNVDEFTSCLKSLRYNKGLPVFLQRNHFFGADWIEHNSWCVTLSTVMHKYRTHAKQACTKINKDKWLLKHRVLHKVVNQKHSVDDIALLLKKINIDFLPIIHEIMYLPLEFILKNWHNVQKDLSNFFLVVIVRPNWNLQEKIGTNINVSHVGVGLKSDKDLLFYHASCEEKRVAKTTLCEYLEYCKSIPTIGGVVFLDIPILDS